MKRVLSVLALAAAPDDAAARNDLAVSLMMEGRTRQALATLAPMQHVDDTPQRLRVNLGILYAATGDAGRLMPIRIIQLSKRNEKSCVKQH